MLFNRQDFLHAIRSARRTPVLTCVVVLALAVGIGLNAGVFTILNFMLLEPPTDKNPSTFVQIYPRYEGWPTGAGQLSSFTTADFKAISSQAHAFEDVAAWASTSATLDDARKRLYLILSTCNYFAVFGVDRPILGRYFVPEECAPGSSAHVTVLSEYLWRNVFGSDAHIAGRTIHLSSQSVTVIGVRPTIAANQFGNGLWMPFTLRDQFDRSAGTFADMGSPWLTIAGRLRSGFSRGSAKAELDAIMRRQDQLYLQRGAQPFDRMTRLVLTNGSFIQNPVFQPIVIAMLALILGPLSLVLLLACVNVTMLFLSRSVVRRGEIAIRLALGVGRARLMRMLILESLLTSVAAGALSVYLAYLVPRLIIRAMGAMESGSPLAQVALRPDWRVFIYLGVLVLIATVVSSLAPMRAAFELDLLTALKGREGSATRRSPTTGILVIAQLAMSFVLLTAAVIFARLPGMVTSIDPGFATRQVLSVPLDVDISADRRAATLEFYRQLESRVALIPGVESLAYASLMPFRPAPPDEVRLANQTRGQGRPAAIDSVSVAFFSTFGISLVSGRPFQPSDLSGSGGEPVAIVSEAFAKSFWGNGNPVGNVVITPDDRKLVVIGVARDTRSEHFGMLDGPRLYSLRNPSAVAGHLFVRFSGDSSGMSAAVAQVVQSLDRNQVDMPQSIWDDLVTNAVEMRSLGAIVLFMAGIAVALAITGVYAVVSFAVSQRTREFGIQMVLGATRQGIFRSVLLRGTRQIAAGLLFGMAMAGPAAWGLALLMKKTPLPLKTFDPSVYAISAVILCVVGLGAMCLPALRATEVDPIQAIRDQ
jgi:putative ABC transport system permease protein